MRLGEVGVQSGSTYSMSPIFRPPKMRHAIQARKRRTTALAVMAIEFLFSKDVSAALLFVAKY